MNKKQVVQNIIINIIAFFTGLCITFFLSPYIIENLGMDAYGFFHTANTFFSYATILTFAVNSMAGRFIAIAYHQGDLKKAQGYFNTVLVADMIIAVALFIVSIFAVLYLDRMINIPLHLVRDVKWMFFLIFSSSILVVALYAFSTSTFVKNRIDIVAYINMFKSIIRGGVLLLLFAFFKPSLVLIGFASFVILVFEAVSYIGVKRKIMPELIVNIREYDIGLLKDILKAGGWNALNNVNGILTMGLDLLFANIFLGPTAAGVLALARTIPNYFETLMELVKNSFIPALTKGYAKNEDSLTENLKLSFVGLSLLASVILGGIISFGEVFYQLWIPTEDSHMLQLLTIVILFVEFTYAGVRTIPMIFQIMNRLKRQALSSFGGASLSVVIVIVLLKTTSLGLFIIAGVTSVITTLIRMFYLYPLAAKYIKQKWYIFYPEVLKALLSIGLAAAVGLGANMLLRVHSWGGFLAGIMITALAATTINLFIFTNKDQRRTLLGKLKQLVGHSAG